LNVSDINLAKSVLGVFKVFLAKFEVEIEKMRLLLPDFDSHSFYYTDLRFEKIPNITIFSMGCEFSFGH